jgi:hypothetical protein
MTSRRSAAIHYKNAERIKIISERIVDELNKILATDETLNRFLLLYKQDF